MEKKSELSGGILYQIVIEKLPNDMIKQWEHYRTMTKLPNGLLEFKTWFEREIGILRRTNEITNRISNFNINDKSNRPENKSFYENRNKQLIQEVRFT